MECAEKEEKQPACPSSSWLSEEWMDDFIEMSEVKEEKEEKQSCFSEAGEKRRETAKSSLSKEYAGISESVRRMRIDELYDLKDEHPSEDYEISEILTGIHRFTFEEMKDATNDFDDQNIIRKTNGKIYRGFLRGQIVVQRDFFKNFRRGNYRDFKHRIYLLSRLRMNHPNITRLFGYCILNKELMLIYEYTCKASLGHLLFYNEEKHLQLDWERRYNICLGIAKGLAYLHSNTRLGAAGGGIETASIFLDKNFNPKICSFDFTYAYKTYQAFSGHREKDIYYYGVIILELVSGNRFKNNGAQLHETKKERGNLLKFVDPRLGSAYSEEQALKLLELSELCTSVFGNKPSIVTVLGILEGEQKNEELNRNQFKDKVISRLDHSSSSKKAESVRRMRIDELFDGFDPNIKDEHPSEDDISEILTGIHRFTFEEMKDATNDFDDQNIIRKTNGKIYRGFLRGQIAVQRDFLKNFHRGNYRDIQYKTDLLSGLNHPNITNFFGYCILNRELMLIYEYTCKASLGHLLFYNEEKHLQLDWERRYNICLGIAQGLAYLHINTRLGAAGGGIETDSIFLDKNFNPKIFSFYLVAGDMTFRDSFLDYHFGKKRDIYCYGVVILELVSGNRFENNGYQLRKTQKEKGNLLKFVDPRLGSAYSEEQALLLLKLSELCTNDYEHKPSIITVLGVLEGKQKFEELNRNQLEDKVVTGLDYSLSSKTETGGEISSEQMRIFEEVDNLLSTREIHEFTFCEIGLATTNFTDRIQGCANVYLGILPRGVLPDGHQIAVKRFLTSSNITVSELRSEIFPFVDSRHPNIARILGLCRERHAEVMLIYEFMQKRTLSRFLHQQERQLELDMTRIFEICLGVAKGLAYLLQNNFIHGDIKPSNILLDEDFNPKIMNLSPTKRMREDTTYVATKGVGAFGYLDTAYLHSGKFTKEGDVYSYGVVILELVSGKRFFEVNVCQLHECLNKQGNLLQFVDPRLIHSDDFPEKALILLEVSVLCTKPKPADRPSITEVVRKLEGRVHKAEPNMEKVMQESPKFEVCSHEAFVKVRALVLSNSLEEALGQNTKSEIFRLCEILDGSTFLPEARSVLVHRVKDFLTFVSQLSIVCKEDSSYDEDSELASLDEKMKLLNLQNPVASDSNDIIQLAKLLMESRKAVAKRRQIHSKKCIDKGKEDWKFIQTRFK